jgi:nicotine blue oxidoreductase
MVTALVLAAGAGRRMGGIPKALLEVKGLPCLERVAAAARDGGCERALVVIRPGDPDLVALAARLDLPTVENPTPETGMFGSVRVGLEHALAESPVPDGVLVFPVDHPFVRADTIARLRETLAEAPPGSWVQLRFDDRGGHPIALDREGARALLDVPADRTLRRALDEAGLTGIPLAVRDRGAVRNLNTPEDLS